MVIILGLATVVSTFLGGLFALRFRDKLHLVLGFSAGAIIGVTFFDLLPEAIELGGERFGVSAITSIIAIGYLAFMILDRVVMLYAHHDDEGEKTHTHRGTLGAGSLSFHSLLDGIAIGLAFQVSNAVGAIIATAVLVHDFSDGLNTVNLVLKNHGSHQKALRWLVVDSLTPVLGVISTLFFSVPTEVLGVILAVFCGFFLYIGTSDLLPESYHNHPRHLTTVMTVAGVVVLYIAIKLAGV